jgi:DNA/RNA endonuclease G (NUC1)
MSATSRQSAAEAEREISYYSLVVPQPDKTNQLTWKAVEDLVTEASQRLGPIHVLAGPVYPRGGNLPFLVIGPGKTPVPTGLFRVLLRQTRGGTWKSIGFLVPNDGSIERDARKFVSSVAEVEKQTGLVFFSGMDAATAQRLKQSKDLSAFLAEN